MKKSSVFFGIFLLILVLGCGGSKKALKELVGTEPEKKGIEPTEEVEQDKGEDKDKRRISPLKKDFDEVKRRIVLATIYFDFDKFIISPVAKRALLDNAKLLEENADLKVLIEGHCDERGTIDYNLALGEKRTEAVKKFLVEYGINSTRLKTVSYGEEKPVDTGHNEEAWAKNRRCEFKIKTE